MDRRQNITRQALRKMTRNSLSRRMVHAMGLPPGLLQLAAKPLRLRLILSRTGLMRIRGDRCTRMSSFCFYLQPPLLANRRWAIYGVAMGVA